MQSKSAISKSVQFFVLGVIGVLALCGLVAPVSQAEIISTPTSPAANATVANFNNTGAQTSKFDTNGQAVDAHDGDLAYFEGKYHLYGTSYGCGYQLGTVGSAFCGFRSYSSPDLTSWTDDGLLFDPTTAQWQTGCAPPRYGCYRPHVLYNKASSTYVLWINSYDSASGFHVFTSKSPRGPFVETDRPTVENMGEAGTFVNGDFDLFADENDQAYIVYTDINYPRKAGERHHTLRVQKLSSNYRTGIGRSIDTFSDSAEAPSMFKKDNVYYVMYGHPTCSYCGGTNTEYKTTGTALGVWSAARTVNANSCGGQPSFVSQLPRSGGSSVYVYGSDLWHQTSAGVRATNQALANFYWAPLTIGAGAVTPFSCANSVSIPLAANATVGRPRVPAGLDQTSGRTAFRTWCDISSTQGRLQTFTATRTRTLTSISVDTFQSDKPNAGLSLSVYEMGSNGRPGASPLHTTTVPSVSVSWSPMPLTVPTNFQVYARHSYAIVLSSSTTTGCYGVERSDHNPYAGGGSSYRPAGKDWVAESGRDLKFFTTSNKWTVTVRAPSHTTPTPASTPTPTPAPTPTATPTPTSATRG